MAFSSAPATWQRRSVIWVTTAIRTCARRSRTLCSGFAKRARRLGFLRRSKPTRGIGWRRAAPWLRWAVTSDCWPAPAKRSRRNSRIELKPSHSMHQLETVSAAAVIYLLGLWSRAAEEPPREWIESATGHRVIRLSREPGTSSFYFHQNAYTADGDKMVVSTRNGLSTINLQTREIELVVEGRAGNVIVGRKTRQVFYTREGSVFAAPLDTRAARKITTLAREFLRGPGFAVNADETLLAGSTIEGGQGTNFPPPASATPGLRSDNPPGKGAMMERRWAAGLAMALYTVNLKTGEIQP